ncbi:hypothetical protein [Kitasatospora sp. CMC57]|uniref:hypothetical protein n=1 Tax=Kitasatospora sp. CMC57 TaxID=3231513 RepID=UPI0038B67A5E
MTQEPSRRPSRSRQPGASPLPSPAQPASPPADLQLPSPSGSVCCITTMTEHVTVDGTVVRTRWHEPHCVTWTAR